MISSPIKRGKRIQAGYGSNTDLHNLKELFQCQSQGFGERPEVYGAGGHDGLDFVYEDGTELFAPFDGFAYYKEELDSSGAFKGYGKYLTIIGPVYKVVYAHLKERVIMDGWVKAGQLVAKGDSTGFSTGSHLHITVKRVDSNGNVLDRNNGHDGSIDPTPFIVFTMFELRQVAGSPEVWLVKEGRKTHIYNQGALLAISNFSNIVPITQSELDALPDSGLELATLIKE